MAEPKTWVDPQTGIEYEVVWSGDMKDKDLTEARMSRPSDLWSAPDHEANKEIVRPPRKPLGSAPSAAEALSGTGKRLYNKTGRHTSNPDYWKQFEEPKVDYDGGD